MSDCTKHSAPAVGNDDLRWWLLIGRRRAQGIGLTGSDADDYVSHFIFRRALLKPSASPAFMYRSCVNAGIDYLRSRQRIIDRECVGSGDDFGASPSYEPTPEIIALQNEIGHRITAALSSFTDDQKCIFQLCIVEEKSALEAATQLNRTTPAVRQALSNLLKRLRTVLEKEGFTEVEAHEYLSFLGRDDTLPPQAMTKQR